MKQVIFKFFVAAFLTFTASNLSAQNYNNAIGLRLGGLYNGVTYRQFLNEKNAFEVYGTFRSRLGFNFFTATGLYQYHSPISDVEGLNWFVGGGASVFSGSGFTNFGITGIVGLDYTLESAPINFSLDWSPTFFLGDGNGFDAEFFALSVRYVLGRK